MNRKLMELAEKYVTQRKRRMRLFKTVTALALVVAICTSYVLMMPGLTMAAETYCGLEEHTHTADCYVDELTCLISEREATTVFTDIMRCSFEPHHHSSDCYNALGELSCGYWDGYIHEHDEKCYDANGVLICTLEEHPMHKHTDSCYTWEKQLTCTQEESEGHVHTADCYRAKEPTCGLFENDGHVHTDECVTETRTLICTEDIATDSDMPHVHDDSCYEVTRAYTCGLTEGEGAHHHTDDCYPVTEEPTCGRFEGEGAHTHDDSCYETVRGDLKCKLYPDPAKVHTHSASCVDAKTGYYTCGYIQVLRHQHTDACIVTVTAEDSGHHHTADCYERHYICGLEEHTHTADCYYDPTPSPEGTEEPTVAPTEEVTVEPTDEPEATPAPTEEVEVTEEPTEELTETPAPTEEAEATEEPTEEPMETPAPTEEVEVTAEPTEEPEATIEPTEEPAETPAPTEEVEVTVEPTEEPAETPASTEEATVEPTEEPEATVEPTEEPAETPAPTEEPEVTVEPTEEPTVTPEITVIPPMNDIAIQPAEDMDHGFVVTAAEDSTSGLQFTDIIANQWELVDGKYQFELSAGIKIPLEEILKHDVDHKITLDLDNFHIPSDATMDGKDQAWGNDPAFKFRYNRETEKLELWFTEDYIKEIERRIAKGEETDATGSLTMRAEIWKTDIEDAKGDKISIGFGDDTVEVSRPGSIDDSVFTDLRTEKSSGSIDWAKNEISYTIKVSSTKGTNGNDVTLKDIMEAMGKNFPLDSLADVSVSKTGKDENGNQIWNKEIGAGNATGSVNTAGGCCDQTGSHIHYSPSVSDNNSKAETDFVLPPMEAGDIYQITYKYKFRKPNDGGNWNASQDVDQVMNSLSGSSGSEGKWDYTKPQPTTVPTNVKVDKVEKRGGYSASDPNYVTWTVTINSNYFDIGGKELTDTMLKEVIDETGSLRLSATDGAGYVASIKVTDKNGNETTISADDYQNYFTVDATGKLTFKPGVSDKITLVYKTPVEPSSENQTKTNNANFDNEPADATVVVPPDDRYKVEKTVKTTSKDPSYGEGKKTEGNLYPVEWDVKYTFAASDGVKYKLNFGDEVESQWSQNRQNHYMTKTQAEKIVGNLKTTIGALHENQNVAYKILLYTYDENNAKQTLEAYVYDGEAGTTSTLPEGQYYGFRFVTEGEGVTLTPNVEGKYEFEQSYTYETTIHLDEVRNSQTHFTNTASNAGRTSSAQYTVYPNDLVDKKFGDHGVGDLVEDDAVTIHETELYWTIVLRTDGEKHNEILLTENLPQYLEVVSVKYGDSTLWRTGNTLTLKADDKKTDNTGNPEGYEVSNTWGGAKISIKAEVSEVTDADGKAHERILVSMKPNTNNWGNSTILDGAQDMTVVVRCKIKDSLVGENADKTAAPWVNGKLVLGELTNTISVKYDNREDSDHQTTDVTYEEPHVTPKNVQKEHALEKGYNKVSVTYTIDINQAAANLNPSGTMLELKDEMSYDVVGWAGQYPYLRQLDLQNTSVKLYYAIVDENGVPKLVEDENGKGHLVRGAEVPKNLWRMDITETANGTHEYYYPNDKSKFSGTTDWQRKITTIFNVPDERALILVYTVEESIELPPECKEEDYHLGQVVTAGVSLGIQNRATLTTTNEYEDSNYSGDQKDFADGDGQIHYGLIIQKVDSANSSLLLPGTEFTLYGWDSTTNSFQPHGPNGGKLLTDENGQILFYYNSNDTANRPLDPNKAYLLVETKAKEPYLILEDRPLIFFHIPAADADNAANTPSYPGGYDQTNFGNLTADQLRQYVPSGMKGVVDGPYTISGSGTINVQVPNTKERRDLYVTKTWHDESETTRPDSVHVTLRRYKLTEDEYNAVLKLGEKNTPSFNVSISVNGGSQSYQKTLQQGVKIGVEFYSPYNQDYINTGYQRILIGNEEMTTTNGFNFKASLTVAESKNYVIKLQKNNNGVWEDETHNFSSWVMAVTHEPIGMFTPEQWTEIQKHPDDDYEGRSGTLTADNDWTTGWQQLESTGADEEGHKLYYIYYVVEGKVPHYTTSGITYTTDPNASKTTGTVTANLVNTHRPENAYGAINFDVSKEWYAADGVKQTITEGFNGVQVALYKTRWDYNLETKAWTKGNTERIYTTTLAEDNKWSFKTNGLETYTVEKLNGSITGAHAYTYSIVELNAPSGYESHILFEGVPQNPWDYFNNQNLNDPRSDFSLSTTVRGTVTLKNVKIEDLRIDVEKHWQMTDYIDYDTTDALTFRLTRDVWNGTEWVADTAFNEKNIEKTLTITDLAAKTIGLGKYPKFTVSGFTESGEPIKAYYRYKVTEVSYNGVDVPFRISYDPADGYVTAETATEHETVTVTNAPKNIHGLYRFNLTKQWYGADLKQLETSNATATITVKRTKHVYDPATAKWTADESTKEEQEIQLTGAATSSELWETWTDTESVHVEYNADGTVKSAWAYTYEVKEAADGYVGIQQLPANFPTKPSDYFVDGDMTNIQQVYRQPQTDTLPEVTEKNYYIEWFNVRVNKTWARLRDTDSITFTLVRAPIIGKNDDGSPIYGDRETTWLYESRTMTYTKDDPNPVWEFTQLPKYTLRENKDGTVTKVWYQYWITELLSESSRMGYRVTYTYDADKKDPLDMDSSETDWGIVEKPDAEGDDAYVDIYAENAPLLEYGRINFMLSKAWAVAEGATLPESVTLVLIPTQHIWDNAAKKWNSTRGDQIEITMKPDDNGVWKATEATDKQWLYGVEWNPNGTIAVEAAEGETVETAFVYTYELVEVLTSGAEPSYSFATNWPTKPGDIFELAEDGTPIRVKANVEANDDGVYNTSKGSTLYTILNTSATVTNKLGTLNIEKKWAAEPAYGGEENPWGIKEVSITLHREVCEKDTVDANGQVKHDWVFDVNYSKSYIIKPNAEGRWLLTIDNLPLYDDKNGCPYRYYVSENPSAGRGDDLKLSYYKPEFSGNGELDAWGTFYFTFNDAESNVVMTNVPKNLTIDKVWKDGNADGQFAEERDLDIYLYIEKTYDETPGNTKTANVVEKNADIANAEYLKLSPSNLQVKREEINGKWYLHVQGKTTDANWRITLINVASEKNATFTIREVEKVGYLNDLPNGQLKLGYNTVGTITNTPTKLTITKQFTKAYDVDPVTGEQPLEVRNVTVYLQVWRMKVDNDDNRVADEEQYTPVLGALESNMDASLTKEGWIKLTVGKDKPASSATLTLTRLPRYWFDEQTGARGEWRYFVKEVDADGNAVHASVLYDYVRPDTTVIPNIEVTNTLTDISVKKVWRSLENQVTLNPANLPDITLKLMQTTSDKPISDENEHLNDKEFAKITLSYENGKVVAKNPSGWLDGAVTGFINEEGSKNLFWGYKWLNLPAYDANGNVYHYYVVEQTPVGSGWQLETSSPATSDTPISSIVSNREFQITNTPITYVLPETGGVGTWPYTAGGLLLMAAAALLLGRDIKRRRAGC